MLYIYSCPNCGAEVELRRSIAQRDQLVVCPQCYIPEHGVAMKRQIAPSVTAVIVGSHYVGGPSRYYDKAVEMQRNGSAPLAGE